MMNSFDFQVGDEITSNDPDAVRTYIVVSTEPNYNWVVCINRDDGWLQLNGWHYAFRKVLIHKTGRHYLFSEKLSREIQESLAYRYNIAKKLLSDEHITLVSEAM